MSGRSEAVSCPCSGRPAPSSRVSRPPAGQTPAAWSWCRRLRACPALEGAEHEARRSRDPVSQLRHPGPALWVRVRPHGRRPRPHLPDLGRVQPRLRGPGLRLGADLLRLRQRRLAELGRVPGVGRRRGPAPRAGHGPFPLPLHPLGPGAGQARERARHADRDPERAPARSSGARKGWRRPRCGCHRTRSTSTSPATPSTAPSCRRSS